MTKNISQSIEIYKKCLAQGDIQLAYKALIDYVAELKAQFPKHYATGNISPGYLDYTYFPFFNNYLRSKKLRFGIVLNHAEMQIELWLMGQNSSVQKEYWERLKDTEWNKAIKEMPKYSVLEACLEAKIDFQNKEIMTTSIIAKATSLAEAIQKWLEEEDETSD